MKLFLSIKYHADNGNRPQIEGITAALRQRGWEVICAMRDIEEWGERPLPADELMAQTFAALVDCDLLLVELSEKGVGIGIEAGYACARGIPIVVVAPTGGDISTTLQGVARRFGWRDSYAPLDDFSDHTLRRLRWMLDKETIWVEVAYSGMDTKITKPSSVILTAWKPGR